MPTPPPILRPHLDRLEAFQRAVAADRFLVSTGQKPTADPAPFTEFADLSDGSLIRGLLDDGHIDWARELLREYFRATLREATDRLRHAERTFTIDWDGRPHTHAELLAIQRTNPANRAALAAAISSLLARLADEHQRWLAAYTDARARLGFRDHGAFVRVLYPDVDRWAGHAEDWLARTRDDFLARWTAWRERDGLTHSLLSDLQAVGASVRAPPGAPSAVDVAHATSTPQCVPERRRWRSAHPSRPPQTSAFPSTTPAACPATSARCMSSRTASTSPPPPPGHPICGPPIPRSPNALASPSNSSPAAPIGKVATSAANWVPTTWTG
jgi:hypothetical protein